MEYTVFQTKTRPDFTDFDSPAWAGAQEQKLDYIFPESSDHHPDVRVKLLYDQTAIYGIFQVDDRYVRAVHLEDQSMVCKDSCVEFFLQPCGSRGYHSFELNCIGTLLSYFIRDARRIPGGFADSSKLPPEDLALIRRYPSLPRKAVEPEHKEPLRWTIGFEIPLELFTRWGNPDPVPGSIWRGMFYKCGDETSHPHWLSCAEYPTLNFHQPEFFGTIIFH